jgi:putative addiction module component (TIGR02574 family)
MTSLPNDMGIDRLTLQERLDLIAVIWDSIAEKPEALPMPEWHREELDRRFGNRRS